MTSDTTETSTFRPAWRLGSEAAPSTGETTVHIIDDEADVRHAMELLLEGAGFRTRSYSSANAFFDSGESGKGCVVTDLRMPDASGIEVLTRLQQSGAGLPVVVVSGHRDVALAVHAMKKGAIDFIEKPFSAERLIDAVAAAVKRAERSHGDPPPPNLAMLSRREQEVLNGVLAGKSNRIIGQELEISERTVESHRASIMRKTGARNLAELVRLAAAHG
ncbi:two-component system response regulator FixJ [Rhodoblastus acidophilus]|uniref:response regulator transcription factor n=1 Tax=Rhodoblastus acidophilus TaxID=1074 RepID=UPI0029CABD16|nr:response regulator [Rhodoblastus acidophilus]MCW2285890.1 two-component system response regulator FixJ [Rhodoblastus acidophilus]MCW2334809.1 two-component system response regulator FixJ [Rhodoblastus acidophilus]